jgi:aspartate racemase
MGPEATVDFMSRVLRVTPANVDQDHVRMIVEQNPHIPSRQNAIRGTGESPGPAIAEMAARLQAAGADFLVMPCNLAHAWQGEIVAATQIPFVSIIDTSVAAALERSGDDGAIGLMTTPGCFEADLYQSALAATGRPVVLQTGDELDETMTQVARIKGGDKSEDVARELRALGERLVKRGATVLIAACTEFPLVMSESMFDVAYISSTDELARETVAVALGSMV